jgi:hypothetical protein
MQTLKHVDRRTGDDVTARHESAARGLRRPVLLTAVLGLVLAGAAACGTGKSGSETVAATPAAADSASAAPTESPSPEPTTPSPSPTPSPTASKKGPIAIASPAEGSGVSRTFVVKGKSQSGEGAIVWQLLKGAKVVADGIAQGGAEIAAPYEFTVKAPAAGTYTVRVFEESAKDGSAINEVRRTVVVG